jgi:hypothetical protein
MRGCVLSLGLIFITFVEISAQSFPDRLAGTWTGVMVIFKDGKVRDSVNVRFSVKGSTTPNTWSWKTEYLSEKMPMTKDYTLKLSNEASQTYALDEGGGVVLYDYLFGNKLYCVFETEQIMLTSSYELRGAELIFEVTSGRKIEGGTGVTNYTVQHLQRAVLRRTP